MHQVNVPNKCLSKLSCAARALASLVSYKFFYAELLLTSFHQILYPDGLEALSIAVPVAMLLMRVISRVFYGKNCDALIVIFLVIATAIRLISFGPPAISLVIRVSCSQVVIILLHAVYQLVFKKSGGKKNRPTAFLQKVFAIQLLCKQ